MSAKILLGTEGLGVPDSEVLQRRAFELARIQEREIPNADDWEAARREVHGHRLDANQTDEGLAPEELVSAAEPLEAGEGERLRGTLEMEDAINVVEELVREGMEEAEHERMLLGHRMEGSGEESFEE